MLEEELLDETSVQAVEACPVEDESNGPFDLDFNDEDSGPGIISLLDDDDRGLAEVPVADVAEIDTEKNRECLERVKRNVKKYAELYWDLARDIYEINSGKLYRIAGYKTFEEYVSTELEFSRRKALHYVKIYKYFAKTLKANLADQPELYEDFIEAVKRLGWTKAEKIARRRILTSENSRELLSAFTTPNEKGNLPSVVEVESIVETHYNGMKEEDQIEADEENEIQTVRMNFNFSKAQANPVTDALDLAKGIFQESGRSNVKPSSLLSLICSEYATNYTLDRGGKIDVGLVMDRLSDALDADIKVTCRSSGRLLFDSEQR